MRLSSCGLKAGPLDRSTYSLWVHGDGVVVEVDQLWVKAGPLDRSTYSPWVHGDGVVGGCG